MSRFRWPSLKHIKLLCALSLVLFGVLIYFFSDDSRIRALSVSGNYYYTPQQIYSIAGISSGSRILFEPSFLMEQRLESDPLIEQADVRVSGQSVSIDVKEKLIIGYYVRDGQNFVLCSDGQSIPAENVMDMKNLIHVPLLADLSDETMQMICSQFQDYPEYLNREILEKIAEILPWSESYDSNMLKLIMQDGNSVFTSIDSLHMISRYQLLLTELQGEDVCLLLDGSNDIIDKIACDYFAMSAEERESARDALRTQQKDAEESLRRQQEEEAKKQQSAETQQPAEQTPPENTAAREQNGSDQGDPQQPVPDPEAGAETEETPPAADDAEQPPEEVPEEQQTEENTGE